MSAEPATTPTSETENTTTSSTTTTPVVHPSGLSLDERFALCRSVGCECIEDGELRNLLDKKPNPICYDGFEPSGRMHIAQGILKAINVNKLTRSGCSFVFWVADWFALLNNKMGGNLKHIRLIGRYMIEVWKACGMDMDRVTFLWSSDEINKNPDAYWSIVIDIARAFNLTRVKRCSQIMGRSAGDDMPSAQILYPCMQCADIFFLKADICQLGLDQRKVNMLARDYCNHIKRKLKPVILSHPMMAGLGKGEEKMSKSKPDSAIFMEDDEKTVVSKINKAYCPPRQLRANPCLDYLRHIVFPRLNVVHVNRDEASGGNVVYESIEQLEDDYERGLLHPGDLKKALSAALNDLIRPVREHFQTNPEAKKLLAEVKKLKVTR